MRITHKLLALSMLHICVPSALAAELATAGPEPTPVQRATIEIEVGPDSDTPLNHHGHRQDWMNDILAVAEQRSTDMQKCLQEIDHFDNKQAALKARANDALNSIFMFKGVSVSSEAGDVILDEKLKINSKGAAKLRYQQLADELELNVVSDLLQIAQGSGNEDQDEGAKQVADAKADLAKLVGDEAASNAVTRINAISGTESKLPNLSLMQFRSRIKLGIETALRADPIVDEVRQSIHRFNTHSKFVLGVHRFARTTLSIVSLAPNFAGPAAQAALFGYVVLSGGSEQSKILKEMYLGKRLEYRAQTLHEEVHLACDSYRLAALSHNLRMKACSEQILARLTGDKFAGLILATPEAEFKQKLAMKPVVPMAVGGQSEAAVIPSVAPVTMFVHDSSAPSVTPVDQGHQSDIALPAVLEAAKEAANVVTKTEIRAAE